MGDPNSAAGAHDRLERGDQAARRGLKHDLAVDPVVNIGLAVRDDDDLGFGQILIEKLMQRFRRPFHVNAVGVFSLEPKLGQHGLDVPPDRQLVVSRAIVGAP